MHSLRLYQDNCLKKASKIIFRNELKKKMSHARQDCDNLQTCSLTRAAISEWPIITRAFNHSIMNIIIAAGNIHSESYPSSTIKKDNCNRVHGMNW